MSAVCDRFLGPKVVKPSIPSNSLQEFKFDANAIFGLEGMPVSLQMFDIIPQGERIFIVSDFAAVQFLEGDRPQDAYGKEACLVRNHRFPGFYFLRTNGLLDIETLNNISMTLQAAMNIKERNMMYLRDQVYMTEEVVGYTTGATVVRLEHDHSVLPNELSLVMYNKAIKLSMELDMTGNAVMTWRKYNTLPDTRMVSGNAPPSDSEGSAPLDALYSLSEHMDSVSGDQTSPNFPSADETPKPATFGRGAGNDSGKTLVPRHLNKKTNALYKTEMCKNWSEMGDCRYGKSCQFAHGRKELRTVQRHGQWKTKTCIAWVNGGCTYGSRCCYAHEFLPQNGGGPAAIALREQSDTEEQTESSFSDVPSTSDEGLSRSRFAMLGMFYS